MSFTFSSLTEINAVVPPTVIFPLTFKLELIIVAPLTVRPVNTGLSVKVIVAPIPDAVAVTFDPTKLIIETLPAVPTTEPSSRIVRPVIAPADAAGTQDGAEVPPFDWRTNPDVPFAKNTVVSAAD